MKTPKERRSAGSQVRDALLPLLIGVAAVLPTLPIILPRVARSSAINDPSVIPPGFQRGRNSGLLLPRFVSLKSRIARMRVGPSFDYAVKWVYTARNLPMEVIEEYGQWREVRDVDGISGWMNGALLSGKRTGIIGPWLKRPVSLRDYPRHSADEVAALEPRVRLSILNCNGKWCRVRVPKHDASGYLRQPYIWGVYPNEVLK